MNEITIEAPWPLPGPVLLGGVYNMYTSSGRQLPGVVVQIGRIDGRIDGRTINSKGPTRLVELVVLVHDELVL